MHCSHSFRSAESSLLPEQGSPPASPHILRCPVPYLLTKASEPVETFTILRVLALPRGRTTLSVPTHDARGPRCLSIARFGDFHRTETLGAEGCAHCARRVGRRRDGLLHNLLSRLPGELQDPVGQDSQIKRGGDADGQSYAETPGNRSDGNIPPRLPHIHHNDDAQVVIGSNGAVHEADQAQPD